MSYEITPEIRDLLPIGARIGPAPIAAPGEWIAHDQLRALALVVDHLAGYHDGEPVHIIGAREGFAYMAWSVGGRYVWIRCSLGCDPTVETATVASPEWTLVGRVVEQRVWWLRRPRLVWEQA
jgi:hypothetical protein